MAYYFPSAGDPCIILTASTPPTMGLYKFCKDVPAGMTYSAQQFENNFPNCPFVHPSTCTGGGGGGGTPPGGGGGGGGSGGGSGSGDVDFRRDDPTTIRRDPETPETGDPPPEECGEQPITGEKYYTDRKRKDLEQPVVAGLVPLPVLDGEGLSSKPTYNTNPRIDEGRRREGYVSIDAYHEGQGDGLLVVCPPELSDYHLWGSGNASNSRWPTTLSEPTLLMLNSDRADASTGDSARVRLAFGTPKKNSRRPATGGEFELDLDADLAENFLIYKPTDSDANDDTDLGFGVKGHLYMTPSTLTGSPEAGMLGIDSADSNKLKWHDGTQWQEAGGGGDEHRLYALLTADSTTNSTATMANAGLTIVDIPTAEDTTGWWAFKAVIWTKVTNGVEGDGGMEIDFDDGSGESAAFSYVRYSAQLNHTDVTDPTIRDKEVLSLATDVTIWPFASGETNDGAVIIEGVYQAPTEGTGKFGLRHSLLSAAFGEGATTQIMKGSWMELRSLD